MLEKLILMLFILLVAAGVRFHNLGAQSLWYDEGVAYVHSLRTFPALLEALQANVHGPAYFGLLGLWEDFTGHSEFALRALSVMFSLLSVALTYALGKRLFSPIAGLAAAAFVALNTFSIYYAQEARMYAMTTAIGAASMWVLVSFLQHASVGERRALPFRHAPRFRYSLALGLLNAIGVYTHYSYALVMVAQGLMAVIWFGMMMRETRRAARALGWYVAANLVTIVLFLPWMERAIESVTAQPNISDPIPVADVLRLIAGWFAFGRTFEQHIGSIGVAVYFFLLFGLLNLPLQEKRPHATWRWLLPVVWIAVSVAIYLYLELSTRYLRFILPAQIAFALWMGRGVWVLWTLQTRERSAPLKHLPKFAAVFASGVVLLNMANGLPYLYTDPAHQRDDYRGIAAMIESEEREGDAIILDAPGLIEIFGYYYDGDLPVYPLPQADDDEQTRANTRQIIADHDRIFTLFWGTDERDPNGVVESTLNNEAYQVSDQWVGSVRFVRYVTPANFPDVVESDARFGDHITLESYALNTDTVTPGDVIQLQLTWVTDAPLETRYKVFVQLLNPDGSLAAQRDSEPGGGIALTTRWQPGRAITDNHALPIPDILPPGNYTLIVGLYDLNDPFGRLPVGDGDFLEIAIVRVRAVS